MTAPAQVNGAAIRALVDAYRRGHNHMGGFACCSAHDVADAAPDLLAEIARLREERHTTNESLDSAAKAIREKDARIAELEAEFAASTAAAFITAATRMSAASRDAHRESRGDQYIEALEHAETVLINMAAKAGTR